MRMERGIFNGALIVLSLLVTLMLGGVTNGRAADIRVLSGGAVKPALTELAKASQKETGHRVDFTFATVGTLQQQVAVGLGTGSASADAAAAFIRFLTTPAARARFAELGLDCRE